MAVGLDGTAGAQRGAALLEVAISLALLAIISLGITDTARAYVLSQQVHSAAETTALFAASHPGQLHNVPGTPCADPGNATWQGSNPASGLVHLTFVPDLVDSANDCNPSPMPAGLAAGKVLKVTAAARLTLSTPLIGWLVGRVEVSATECVVISGPPSTVRCR
jgi:Flp pilus assembly protein TadG